MTLQWTVVAVFLYAEALFLGLLLLPWIRPPTWNKVFKSRIVRAIQAYSYIYSYTYGGVLVLLFLDGIREVRKYSHADKALEVQYHTAHAESTVHMRLFRAQRNLYIAGFALFLWFVIRRVIHLISQEALLMASAEAAMKQARSATMAADAMMDGKHVGSAESKSSGGADAMTKKVKQLECKLKQVEQDRDAVKEQAEGTKREYDRMMKEYEALQVKVSVGSGNKSKKDN